VAISYKLAEAISAEDKQRAKKEQEMYETMEYKDYTVPWADKLRYRFQFEIPDDFAASFPVDDNFDYGEQLSLFYKLYYPYAFWNDGDVWLDQCELITLEVDSADEFMVLGTEKALHVPIGGMETRTWRKVAPELGFETITALGKELNEPTLTATYDTCPHWIATLGAAMGWVVLLEATATVLFLGLLMPCGIVKNDKAPFKAIISQVLNEGIGGEAEEKNPTSLQKKSTTATNTFNTMLEMQNI